MTRSTLREHRRRYLDRRLSTKGWQGSGLVFADVWVVRCVLSEAFTRLLRRAGLPPMQLYDLRHFCATILGAQGLPDSVIMELLGHSSITLTANT